MCYPDGERNAQRDINDVSPDDGSHVISFPWLLLSEKSSFQEFERPWNHLALLGLGQLGDDAVRQLEKIAQGFKLFVERNGLEALETFRSLAAIFQDS